MNEQNISDLKRGFQAIGFEDGLEYALRSNMCFRPPHFFICRRIAKENDILHFHFHLTLEEQRSEYHCTHYEVMLRKEILIPDTSIGDINLREVDQQMKGIDWAIEAESSEIAPTGKKEPDWSREKAIEEIILVLQALEQTEEGKPLSQLLKLKHWLDTPLEKRIEGIMALKSGLEISQRFYFFSSQDNITAEEAYRFLQNKWMERKLQDAKKRMQKDTKTLNNRK